MIRFQFIPGIQFHRHCFHIILPSSAVFITKRFLEHALKGRLFIPPVSCSENALRHLIARGYGGIFLPIVIDRIRNLPFIQSGGIQGLEGTGPCILLKGCKGILASLPVHSRPLQPVKYRNILNSGGSSYIDVVGIKPVCLRACGHGSRPVKGAESV